MEIIYIPLRVMPAFRQEDNKNYELYQKKPKMDLADNYRLGYYWVGDFSVFVATRNIMNTAAAVELSEWI